MLACAIKLRNSEEKCTRECTKYQEYRTEKIISYLQKHKEYKQIVILLSGDTGFYSGAKNLRNQLLEKLSLVEEKKIKILPGISSLSYLASKRCV